MRRILTRVLLCLFVWSCSLDLSLGMRTKAFVRFERALLSWKIYETSVLQPSILEIQALEALEEQLTETGWNQPEEIQKSANLLSETFSFPGLAPGELETDLQSWEEGNLVWPKRISPVQLREIRDIHLTQMSSYYTEQLSGIQKSTAEERQSLKLNVSAGIYLYSYLQEADQRDSSMDLEFQKENLQWLVRIREAVIREQMRRGEEL
ncbi:hypothetical protein [Leptospira wolffii]|uniref:hypothetical protein n=1 Tax=Leptospira wolffii TaxID=409998 RepID=UPI0003546515|nr:hypothetical protein [Leptospira wolffii]EPG67954.1 hypothetical protein LEP1GSC061_0669 [Leptospira wolffii serovar Khorat str. Khorat-H2]